MTELGTLGMTEDGRCALRFERQLGHPPEKVWRAITEVDQLRWWFAGILDYDRIRFELAPGSELAFVPKREYAQVGTGHGEVTRIEKPRLLEYTWGTETLRWELEPHGESGCRLVFTNIFDDRGFASAMGAGWHAALERLEDFLAGRDPDQSPLETDESAWQQLQTNYAQALDGV